jgi:hypothetical protein
MRFQTGKRGNEGLAKHDEFRASLGGFLRKRVDFVDGGVAVEKHGSGLNRGCAKLRKCIAWNDGLLVAPLAES